MEAIQKALTKAKRHQLYKDKSAQQNKKVDSVRPDAIADAGTQNDQFSYKTTKVIAVSDNELVTRRVLATKKNNAVADVFKILRTQVLMAMRKKQYKTLAVTGATDGVGKSLVAVNLAISMAMETNQTVLLVDLDLKRPRIGWYFGFEPEVGLDDYLVNETPLSSAMVNPGIERLVLLPGRDSYHNSSEIVSSKKMQDLIDELKTRYESRIIIFDLPPLLASDDALSLMPNFDAVLMVIENGRNTRGDLTSAQRLLGKTDLLGVVLNKGVLKQSSYY